jgi:hypothetical protein
MKAVCHFMILTAAVASLIVAPGNSDSPPFRDVTQEAGITFVHHAAPEKKYIVESMSGGVALFDFDRDGLIDIYFVNSLTVETADNPTGARSALYRNLGGFKFEDVTDKAGVGTSGLGYGSLRRGLRRGRVGRPVRDGARPNRLYRNSGDGTFTRRGGFRRRRRRAGPPAAASRTTIATATSISSWRATSASI